MFLYVGRLSPEKGCPVFCKAVRAAGVKGVVVGDGIQRKSLEAQYTEITFTGWLNHQQIFEQFKKARCFIFPSICYETLGLVVLEANAYGLPVIASDCSAASDNAQFIYHSLDELAALIKRVSTEDIKQLSLDVFHNFDESVTINHVDNLLKVYSHPLV